MSSRNPIYPGRVRRVPRQFSWVDHRLVRDRYIEYCSHAAAALYLFLVTVADAQGLSYYSDAALMQRLAMDGLTLEHARQNLLRLDLIAYMRPIYQVLALPDPLVPVEMTLKKNCAGPQPLGEIFKKILEQAA